VVVWRRADAPETEHQIVACERIAQQRREAFAVIAQIVDDIESEAARG
jgi:molybdopterin synthase catalytic subunit